MGLFDWLGWLFGGGPEETAEDVADRLERFADRFRNAGDDEAASAAREAADTARKMPDAAAARRIEADFLASRGLRPDGRPIKPALGRAPDGSDYVRYGAGLRAGGSRAWRYHNPGYVRCNSRADSYGAIGCDGELAIFPDDDTGLDALWNWLRDEYPGQTVRDALQQHLPPEAGADPAAICAKAGLDPAAKVEDLTDGDCHAIGSALEARSGWEEGRDFGRGAEGIPDWVESAWAGGDSAESAGAGAEEADAPGDAGPTDNS